MHVNVRPTPAPPTREQITRRCAQILAQRSNLDPTGPAYQACSMQLDDALSALFLLGPRDPWDGEPA